MTSVKGGEAQQAGMVPAANHAADFSQSLSQKSNSSFQLVKKKSLCVPGCYTKAHLQHINALKLDIL